MTRIWREGMKQIEWQPFQYRIDKFLFWIFKSGGYRYETKALMSTCVNTITFSAKLGSKSRARKKISTRHGCENKQSICIEMFFECFTSHRSFIRIRLYLWSPLLASPASTRAIGNVVEKFINANKFDFEDLQSLNRIAFQVEIKSRFSSCDGKSDNENVHFITSNKKERVGRMRFCARVVCLWIYEQLPWVTSICEMTLEIDIKTLSRAQQTCFKLVLLTFQTFHILFDYLFSYRYLIRNCTKSQAIERYCVRPRNKSTRLLFKFAISTSSSK